MTPEEVLTFVGQHVGGDAGKALYSKVTKEIDNPDQSAVARRMQPKITVVVETWKTPDGQVVFEGYRDPSTPDAYVSITQNTPKTSASANETVSAPPTQANIVTRRPDGSLQVDPNPNAAAAANTPAGERAAQEQVERQRNQADPSIGIPLTDPDKAAWNVARQKEAEAKDERERAIARQERLDIESSANRIWTQSLQERQLAGTEAERARVAGLQERQQTEAENKPTLIDIPGGGKGQLVDSGRKDASGKTIYEAKPVEGTQAAPSPDIGPIGQQIWGEFSKRYSERVQQRLELMRASNGSYTDEQMRKDLESDRIQLQGQMDEQVKTLNAQQNIRSQDVTQRGQTLVDAGNRQRFAETASTNALNLVTKFPSIAARAGSGEGLTNVLQYLMNMQGEYGKTIGALPDQTPIGRAPGQEQVMGMGIGGPATNGPAPSVGPNGSSPIVFNINTASPAPISPDLGSMGSTMAAGVQPDAASQATPVGSPGSPSQLVDQWADPKDPVWNAGLEQIKAEITQSQGGVDPTHRFAGGQIRAPGAGAVGGGPVSNGAVGAVG